MEEVAPVSPSCPSRLCSLLPDPLSEGSLVAHPGFGKQTFTSLRALCEDGESRSVAVMVLQLLANWGGGRKDGGRNFFISLYLTLINRTSTACLNSADT